MWHFGDPCIHCGTAFDDIKSGPCSGDPKKAKPVSYKKIEQRWDGTETFLVQFSDGRIERRVAHFSFHLPYYHFGHSEDLVQPPRYNTKLVEPGVQA